MQGKMNENKTDKPLTETEKKYMYKQADRIINRIGLDLDKAREIMDGIGELP